MNQEDHKSKTAKVIFVNEVSDKTKEMIYSLLNEAVAPYEALCLKYGDEQIKYDAENNVFTLDIVDKH